MKKFIVFLLICAIIGGAVIVGAPYIKDKMFDDEGNFIFLDEIISDILGDDNSENSENSSIMNGDYPGGSFIIGGEINGGNVIIYDKDGNIISGKVEHEHQWIEATCDTPKTCQTCKETEGEPLGHLVTTPASCMSAAYCDRCHEECESQLPHTGGTPSCRSQAECAVCGWLYGDYGDHIWLDATCYFPKRCDVCGIAEGSSLEHRGGTATCDRKAICDICGDSYGSYSDHKYVDATCTEAKYCKLCNQRFGTSLGHNYSNGKCTRCSASDPSTPKVSHFTSLPYGIVTEGLTVTAATYRVEGNDIHISVTIQKTVAGTAKIGWTVYGSGYDITGQGNTPSVTLGEGETTTITFVANNVITSSHKSYKVYFGFRH